MSAPIGYPPGERLKRPSGANGAVEHPQKRRIRAWWQRNRSRFYLVGFLAVFIIGYLAPRIFISVHTGEAGVMWKRFGQGTITNLVYSEGFHVIPPWDLLTIYDLRVQHREQTVVVLSTNGLSISVGVSVRYRPKLPLLGRLHKEVGPGYADSIVLPEVRSLLRDLFGEYTPEEIYTTKRSLIQDSLSRAVSEIGESFIDVDDLLITSIRLPAALQDAIETKLTQEQRQLEMRFRIGREELEVDRKLIEALGISGYNQVIAGSLTESLLTFTGIGASLELAKSPNAKMVIFGNKQGLPLILDSRALEAIPGTTNTAAVTNQVVLPPVLEVAVTNVNAAAAERIIPRVRQWIQDSTNSFNKIMQAMRRP